MGARARAPESITKWRDAGYIEMSYQEVQEFGHLGSAAQGELVRTMRGYSRKRLGKAMGPGNGHGIPGLSACIHLSNLVADTISICKGSGWTVPSNLQYALRRSFHCLHSQRSLTPAKVCKVAAFQTGKLVRSLRFKVNDFGPLSHY